MAWKPVLPRKKPGREKGCKDPYNSGKRKKLNPDWERSDV